MLAVKVHLLVLKICATSEKNIENVVLGDGIVINQGWGKVVKCVDTIFEFTGHKHRTRDFKFIE